MESADLGSVAGRWFAVRAEYERLGPLRSAWLVVKEFFIGLLTWGLTMGDFDPKRFCDVLVLRRDTDEVIVAYSYNHLSEATLHVERLRVMLKSTQVFDFCRELGLGIEAVAGPGENTSSDLEELWFAIPARLRRSA